MAFGLGLLTLLGAKASGRAQQSSAQPLVAPGNGGVAGTGLGGSAPKARTGTPKTGAAAETSGTGMSVPGPPGQGINGQGGGQLGGPVPDGPQTGAGSSSGSASRPASGK